MSHLVISQSPVLPFSVYTLLAESHNGRTGISVIAEFKSIALTKNRQTENDLRSLFGIDSIYPFAHISRNKAQGARMKSKLLRFFAVVVISTSREIPPAFQGQQIDD